jgi:hypothetical protein
VCPTCTLSLLPLLTSWCSLPAAPSSRAAGRRLHGTGEEKRGSWLLRKLTASCSSLCSLWRGCKAPIASLVMPHMHSSLCLASSLLHTHACQT